MHKKFSASRKRPVEAQSSRISQKPDVETGRNRKTKNKNVAEKNSTLTVLPCANLEGEQLREHTTAEYFAASHPALLRPSLELHHYSQALDFFVSQYHSQSQSRPPSEEKALDALLKTFASNHATSK